MADKPLVISILTTGKTSTSVGCESGFTLSNVIEKKKQ
jgi:hypothetical protein